MESSQFTDSQPQFETIERMETPGATCDTYRVKLYGKLHFLKRLKPAFRGDTRYQEALRKEFETGYRLEHPNLVRYISLDDDGILTEYVDGETLSQRLHAQPRYFKSRQNTDKFVRQLLDVVGYLHSHQVLHLDLKPDNILLTHIGSNLKLVDLGCCYTDTFADTTGHTEGFAAPEQLSMENGKLSTTTDIYAIGKILQLLPRHHIYNKVIARCTAPSPEDRYQSVEEIAQALSSHRKTRGMILAAAVAAAIAVFAAFSVYRPGGLPESSSPAPTIGPTPRSAQRDASVEKRSKNPSPEGKAPPTAPEGASIVLPFKEESIVAPSGAEGGASPSGGRLVGASPSAPTTTTSQQMNSELDRLVDAAYRSTIASFCDSVFPSLTVGQQWEKQSSEFHAQALQTAAEWSSKYPDIPESVVMQHVETRFQALVGYVFNRMRENGMNRTAD